MLSRNICRSCKHDAIEVDAELRLVKAEIKKNKRIRDPINVASPANGSLGVGMPANLRKLFAALKECYKLLRPSLNLLLVHSIPVGSLRGRCGESVNISRPVLSNSGLRVIFASGLPALPWATF